MSESQTLASPLAFRFKTDDDFDVDSKSFWGRSWIPLGNHFRSSWRLFRSKLGQEPSSKRLIFEKMIFHEIIRFPILVVFVASTWRPKTTQDRPKTGPRSSWIDVFSSSIIASIFDRFGIGCVPIRPPKWSPADAAELGKSALVAIQDGLGIDLVRFVFRLVVWDFFLSFLSSSWGRFGPLLAPFWPSSALLAPFGGTPGVIFGLLGADVPFVGAVLQHCLNRCSLHFSTFTFGFPVQLFSLWDSLFNLSRLDLHVRIASRESTHPRGAVPTQPQARIPPDTREIQLQDARVEAGHGPGLADCALRQ